MRSYSKAQLTGIGEHAMSRNASGHRSREESCGRSRPQLTSCCVRQAAEADDGPPDDRIIDTLVDANGGTEDIVVRAVGRVGRLIEIVETIEAAQQIERRASKAAEDNDRGLIVLKGHIGDLAVRNWVAAMMSVYKEVAGSEASHGTSEGDEFGPFLRFLKAAGAPLGIEFTKEQWRNRVRQLRTSRQK